jgi:DNA ligase (NAD+)
MSKQEIEKKIKKLREQILEHDYKYYILSEPLISDEEYDMLMKELEKLEAEYPYLITPDSPTQRVGKDLTKIFKPVTHKIPRELTNSLMKKNFMILIEGWVALPRGEKEYVVELKLMASVSLHI